jgi:hypothetical protein
LQINNLAPLRTFPLERVRETPQAPGQFNGYPPGKISHEDQVGSKVGAEKDGFARGRTWCAGDESFEERKIKHGEEMNKTPEQLAQEYGGVEVGPKPVQEVEKPVFKVVEKRSAPSMVNNKQMFDQNEMRGQTQEFYSGEKGLKGDVPPNFAIEKERPEHRLMLYLKAQGKTNQEIAKMMGYSYGWVCQVVRQPWFRKAFIETCEVAGLDSVTQFLEGEVMTSLETLVELRDSGEKEQTRLTAANSLLDRFLGKPTVKVETENVSKNLDDATKEVETLEQEVANLRLMNGLAPDEATIKAS